MDFTPLFVVIRHLKRNLFFIVRISIIFFDCDDVGAVMSTLK